MTTLDYTPPLSSILLAPRIIWLSRYFYWNLLSLKFRPKYKNGVTFLFWRGVSIKHSFPEGAKKNTKVIRNQKRILVDMWNNKPNRNKGGKTSDHIKHGDKVVFFLPLQMTKYIFEHAPNPPLCCRSVFAPFEPGIFLQITFSSHFFFSLLRISLLTSNCTPETVLKVAN